MNALHAPTHNLAETVARLREEFPILRQQVHGKPVVYLDSAASAQKPQCVIDAVSECYSGYYANVHRGMYAFSERATDVYEAVRDKTRRFINAAESREIIFTGGTTEGINLVAATFGRQRVKAGDEVLITAMEHHSNIVPWQILCEQVGAKLRVAPITDAGELDLAGFEACLNERTRMLAVVHLSNALGTINPVREMIKLAHQRDIPVLVDGAQWAPHLPTDVRELDCDFYAFSSHKIFGPSGVGVLYGKAEHLEAMPPYQSGGDMITRVTFEKTEYAEIPSKFEAGTPNIVGVIGMGAAIDWIQRVGFDTIAAQEQDVLDYATAQVQEIPGLTVIGTAPEKAGVLAFTLEGIHPHDIGTLLDQSGVAIRAGHHCTQPLLQRLRVPATARASFAVYNTREEVDTLVAAIRNVQALFS